MTLVLAWVIASAIILSILLPINRYYDRQLVLMFFQPQAIEESHDQA